MANTFNQNAAANTSGDYLTLKKAKAMAKPNTIRKRRNNFENNLLFSKGIMESLQKDNCKERGIMLNNNELAVGSNVVQGDIITFLGVYSHLGSRPIDVATAAATANNGQTITTVPALNGAQKGTPYIINRAHFFPYTKVSIDRDADGKLTF